MKTYTYPNGTVVRENMSEILEEFLRKPEAFRLDVKKHAFVISANAAQDAPVDTGALKNSLADGVDVSNPNLATISDAVDYGVFQELGTSKGVTAKHFLGGAAEREADPFFADLRKELGE